MNSRRDHYDEVCICNDPHVLVIERKSVGRLISMLLLCGFFVFVAGYFLGKRNAIKAFSKKIQQEAFADQISVSLNTLYDAAAQETHDAQDEKALLGLGLAQLEEHMNACNQQDTTQAQRTVKEYRAELLGGNAKTVTEFIDRLSQRGIVAEPRERTGKTPKGKVMTWHQAVSPSFSTRLALDEYIQKIEKTEKINGIRIVEIV